MPDQLPERPKVSSKRLLWFGVTFSVAYLVFIGFYGYTAWAKIVELKPNELGDFLAGAFSPLAFLWLVLGYMQQGRELENSAEALWLQGRELQNSVTQQRELVEVTREQLAHERALADATDSRERARQQEDIARSKRAAAALFNQPIERISALGRLAVNEIDKNLAEKKFSGGIMNIHLADLQNEIPGLKHQTTDTDLLNAMNDLLVTIRYADGPVDAVDIIEYIREIRERRDRICASIDAIKALTMIEID